MKAPLIVTVAVLAAASLHAADAGNMFPEGNFESGAQLKAPFPNPITENPKNAEEGVLYIEPGDYQARNCKVSIENEDGSSFLHLEAPKGFDGILRTYIALRLPEPAPAAVTIGQRWRMADFAKLEEAPQWAGAQNDPVFVMEDGTRKTINGTLRLNSNTGGEWQEVEKTVSVPAGARILILQPGLYRASGTLDIDDIRVFAE